MDPPALVSRLERFPAALAAALDGVSGDSVSGDDWAQRPAGGGWSLHDVLVHLASEETDDFRVRLRRTLEDPSQEWPPLDPEGVVEAARGKAPAPEELLRRFGEERRASVAWLRSLSSPKWENARVHPTAGPLRAGDLLASWAAHDVRHLAQIAKLLHVMASRAGAPYSVAYAG